MLEEILSKQKENTASKKDESRNKADNRNQLMKLIN